MTIEKIAKIAYAQNLAIMRLPLGSLHVTKTTLADIADAQAVIIRESGDALGHYVRAKLLQSYCDEVIDRIKPDAVAELQQRGFEHPNLKISTAVTGKKYDYSSSLEWCEVDTQIQKLMEHRKALEEVMRRTGAARVSNEGEISPKMTLGK